MKRVLLALAILATPTVAASTDREAATAMGEMVYTLGACYWRGTPAEQAQVAANIIGEPERQTEEEREYRAGLLALYEEGKTQASKLTAPQCDNLIRRAQARVDAARKSP